MSTETGNSQRFIIEAREHLATMSAALIALECAADEPRPHIEQILRSAHSIKGGAGFSGLRKIEQLAHGMETAVETIRDTQVPPTPIAIDALLATLDRIGGMVDDVDHSNDADIADSLARLQPFIEKPSTPTQVHSVPATPALLESPAVAQQSEFPLSDQVRSGWQPGRSLLYGVKFDWFACEREHDLSAVEVAKRLEAVGAVLDSRVTLLGPSLREGLPVPSLMYHAIVSSALEPQEFTSRLDIPCAAVVRLENRSDRFTRAEPAPQALKSIKPSTGPTSLRISVPLIDRMMELAGELALVRNQAVRSTDPANAPLRNLVRRLDSVTTELQGAALRMRMQPVGSLFDRFPRLVRDLARQLNKQIEIKITGSEVELDKTVLETLADPLTHLVRNCCDHGIELPEQRLANGKPAAGVIALSARQDRGQIVIEIRDDGKGLDADAIKRKALQQGIKQPHEIEALSQRQLFDLILLSGFSTAAKVTDLSGRGVGMDVVKTNLDQVGGAIEIDSALGRGSCFSLRLPLTLAIMPCLLVTAGEGVAAERYAIPQRDLEEIVLVEPGEQGAKAKGPGRIECTQDEEVLRLRGALIPLVRLSEILASRDPFTATTRAATIAKHHGPNATPRRQYVAILRVGSHRFGLVVDNVLESEEIVVKPLHPLLRPLGVFVAATILGDGGISLILGCEGIARHCGLLHRPPQQLLPDSSTAPEKHETLLLFRVGPAELLAMPLSEVQRVVRIGRDKIEHVGQRELVRVDGSAFNILRLDQLLQLSPPRDLDELFLILPRNGNSVGLLASEIVDTPSIALHVDDRAYKMDGVPGSVMVRDQIALFLDINRLLQIWTGIQAGTAPRLPQATRQRLLLVEDTQFFQRLVMNLLESEGFDVTLAVNGADGLQKLEDGNFDLVISDIEMPILDGFSLARKVREDPRHVALPLLALTTLSDADSRGKATAAGFDAYEVKLDRVALLATIRALLNRRSAALLPGGSTHA